MEQPLQNQSTTPQQSETIQAKDLMNLISNWIQTNSKKEQELERMRIEVEKARLEAEQKTETQNKIYGWILVVLSLGAYTALLWFGKATEGYGVLITAVVTSSLAGIFKGIVGRKRKSSESDAED